MKVALIGRTGAGRNTLFEALTGGHPARQPGRTRLGIARVRDPRIDSLTAICNPKKTVYAEFTLAVPPGSMDVTPLREMRDLKAYVHVIGAFGGEPVEDMVIRELAGLKTEMVLADMERVEKRLARIAKGGGDRPGEKAALAQATTTLEKEAPLRSVSWDEQATLLLDDLGMLSHRPLLSVVNVTEDGLGHSISPEISAAAQNARSELMWLCATLEQEIVTLDPDAQAEFLTAYGLTQPVSQRFAHACLTMLDLICFFTIGPDEVRAWPVTQGTLARRAAGAIHSDLERGFIRAEVVDFDTLIACGSETKCRAAGKQRVEGKEYVVKDGDIFHVRFSV